MCVCVCVCFKDQDERITMYLKWVPPRKKKMVRKSILILWAVREIPSAIVRRQPIATCHMLWQHGT